MFELYNAQKRVVDKIENALLGKNGIKPRNFILLTGEVGSGKTYMATNLIRRLDRKTLVVLPNKNLIKKWEYVTSIANVKATFVTSYDENVLNEYELVIYDEVHTIKTKTKHFTKYWSDNKKLFVGLTGSTINKSINELCDLFNYYITKTNHESHALSYANYKKVMTSHKGTMEPDTAKREYINNYIKYLYTVGISKEDIEEITKDNEIKINTIKHNIEMDYEEKIFYKFLEKRTHQLGLTQSQKINILNKRLDRLNQPDVIKVRNKDYYIGKPLHKANNNKLLKLKEILKDNKGIIVYTFDDDLANYISTQIENSIYIQTKDNANIDLINETLKETNVIVNIRNILLGHDIFCDTAVFYQTPEGLELNVQAIGRISRINNSQNEKNIHYLYHKNTIQEKTIEMIEKNNQTNNSLINKTDKKQQDEYLLGMKIIR